MSATKHAHATLTICVRANVTLTNPLAVRYCEGTNKATEDKVLPKSAKRFPIYPTLVRALQAKTLATQDPCGSIFFGRQIERHFGTPISLYSGPCPYPPGSGGSGYNFGGSPDRRIATAATQVGTGANAWGQSYGYDAWANLQTATVTQGTAPALNVSVNTQNHITNPGFAYDAAGNLTSDGFTAYSWDAEGHLKGAGATTYTYDEDGKRVEKITGKLYWYGGTGLPVTEIDLTGNNPVE